MHSKFCSFFCKCCCNLYNWKVRIEILSCPLAGWLYRAESLHPLGYSTTAAVLRDTIRNTPCAFGKFYGLPKLYENRPSFKLSMHDDYRSPTFAVIMEGTVFQSSTDRVHILLRFAAVDRSHVFLYLNIIYRLFYSCILTHLIRARLSMYLNIYDGTATHAVVAL
jgi:hypothetical protein